MTNPINQAVELIKNSKHITAFTGAGISIESGIPVFRGKDGLWEKFDPKYLDLRYFKKHPKESWQILQEIIYNHFGAAKPNPAHFALAKLEEHKIVKAVITQNIDNLHQDAGSKNVFEFHGNSQTLICLHCNKKFSVKDISLETLPPLCDKCNKFLKPDIIFFGETIPKYAFTKSEEQAKLADLFIIVGTTGEVMPAAGIPPKAKSNGAKIIEINPYPSSYTKTITDVFIQEKAGIALPEIVKNLLPIFLVFLFCLCFSTIKVAKAQNETPDIYKFKQVMNYINSYYVDSIKTEKIIDAAIITVLKELDPHSTYINKKDVDRMNQSLEGSFEGIGIDYNIVHDTLIIISPRQGGPADKVGILPGDRIEKIENEIIAGMGFSNEDIHKKLAGKKGTIINLSIRRQKSKKLIEFQITREDIPIYSVESVYMAAPEIGYIRLNRFAATSIEEFHQAWERLQKQKAKKLILDIRDNGGGYLNTAVELADEFLSKEKLIVYTEGDKSIRTDYNSTSKGIFEKGKLVLLVDEGSASASEILAGAIQDWDRGVIIGRRTFGKGLVQRPFRLVDGSMIRLTISRYYTPSGRLIQKSYTDGYKAYREDINNRFLNGELINKDSIKFPDSLKFLTLLKKRIVFGGGGIMPDIFIPLDTTSSPDFYQSWTQKGIINSFILKYVDNNRIILQDRFKSFEQFKINYIVDNNLFEQLIDYAQKEELKKGIITNRIITVDDFKKAKINIAFQLKALIARDLWTSSEYFEIVNSYNQAYLKAVEILSSKELYEKCLDK